MSNGVPSQIYEILKDVIKGNIENFEITIHDANKKGDGFLGEMVFITLEDKDTNKALDLVVKQAFTNEKIRSTNPIREVFINEIYFYSQVWPRLNKFQERIPKQNQFRKLPKYLASVSEDSSEKMVLENLKFQGFQVHDKTIPLDKQHFEFIFNEYGKFHALSFAYKALYPENYADLVKGILDVYTDFMTRESFNKAIKVNNEICLGSLQPGIDDKVIEKFKPYIEDYEELFQSSLDSNGKYTVITHGDCWSNNMMFKYDETGKVIDVRFLDFQLSKVGSPCCDLTYCLYSGAPKEVLKDLDHYLQIYHNSLSDTLRAFGCDPEKLFPFKELRTEWRRYCKMGVMMSLMIWRVKCTYEDQMKDLNDTVSEEEHEEAWYDGFDKDYYKEKTRSLILHLYENDFL